MPAASICQASSPSRQTTRSSTGGHPRGHHRSTPIRRRGCNPRIAATAASGPADRTSPTVSSSRTMLGATAASYAACRRLVISRGRAGAQAVATSRSSGTTTSSGSGIG